MRCRIGFRVRVALSISAALFLTSCSKDETIFAREPRMSDVREIERLLLQSDCVRGQQFQKVYFYPRRYEGFGGYDLTKIQVYLDTVVVHPPRARGDGSSPVQAGSIRLLKGEEYDFGPDTNYSLGGGHATYDLSTKRLELFCDRGSKEPFPPDHVVTYGPNPRTP
jgi:hypothetical protein